MGSREHIRLICAIVGVTVVSVSSEGFAQNSVPVAKPVSRAANEVSPAIEEPPPSAVAADNDFVLSDGDTVSIVVFREPELDMMAMISRDGTITVPLLGDVKVGGKTVRQARDMIRDSLAKDYLVNPQVTLAVTKAPANAVASSSFTILGQVKKPGSYPLPGKNSLSLLQAIGLAGGYGGSPDLTKIILRRKTDKGTIVTAKINLKKLEDGGASIYLLPNDVISVSERAW